LHFFILNNVASCNQRVYNLFKTNDKLKINRIMLMYALMTLIKVIKAASLYINLCKK